MDNTMKMQLHNEIASAIELVWLMQISLTESAPVNRLLEIAEALKYRADVINGHMARWALMQAEDARPAQPAQPGPSPSPSPSQPD